MSAFCHVDDAYNRINNDDVDLDKMARQVNEQKKRKARDIYRNYRTDQATLSRGIDAFNSLSRGGYDKGTDIPQMTQGFFSAQGEYSDITAMYDNKNDGGLLISDIIGDKKSDKKSLLIKRKRKKRMAKKDILKDMAKNTYYAPDDLDNMDNLEISTIADSDLSEISDLSFLDDASSDTLISNSYGNSYNRSYSKPLSKMKTKTPKKSQSKAEQITLEDIYREIKLGSKYTKKADETAKNVRKRNSRKCIDYDLQSIDSLESLESGESLLEHINNCNRCRDQVVDLIRKSRDAKQSKIESMISESEVERDISKKLSTESVKKTKMDMTGFELKEILTVCLIGFLVIIILDLTINYRSRF